MGQLSKAFAALLLATALTSARGDEPAPEPSTAAGNYFGPPLWRVSKGDHELWLFGTLGAVPETMRWSPAGVERAIGDAQEVLLPPGISAKTLKPVQLVRVWRRLREMSANPEGKQLAQVLPADLYRRYSELRDRHMRRVRNLEGTRPIIVGLRVYQGAVADLGLVSGRDVQSGIERVARRADVETTETKLHVDIEVLLDHAALVPAQAEIDCFARVLGTLEPDESVIAARARAWAIGDIEALRSFDYRDIQGECVSLPGWPEGLREILQSASDKWLEAAERALSANRTTFGTLDLRELMSSNGLLAQLRERGYEVRSP